MTNSQTDVLALAAEDHEDALRTQAAPVNLRASLRDTILKFDDTQREVVEVPEWGGIRVMIKGMSGAERAQFLAVMQESDEALSDEAKAENIAKLYPTVLIRCMFDPDTDERIFLEGDEDLINTKSGAALERLAQTAIRLSGMTQGQEDAAGKGSSSKVKSASISS